MAGVELAAAYVSIIPEVSKAVSAAYSQTAAAGKSIGKAIGEGVSSGATTELARLEAAAQAASGKVKSSSRDMEAAQRKAADAAGALRVATERLNEVRNNSAAKASQVAAAEESVAKAQRASEVATKNVATSTQAHSAALDRAKTSTANFSTAQGQANTTISKHSKIVGKMGDAYASVTSKMSGLVGQIGAGLLAGFGVAKIGQGISSAIKAATDLGETVNKANVIFGTNSAKIDQWASGAAKSMGLSKQAALEAASGFGDMFLQLGFAGDTAADMSKQVVQMSADLGSFNNLPTAEVTQMISAAFRGEYDSLQRLIPNISAARVEQQALAMTHKTSAKDLTASEKAAATLAIVQQDGARAAGDFARTSESAANQAKINAAVTEDLSAKLGGMLMPAYQALQTVGLKVLEFLTEHSSIMGPLAAGIAVGAVALGLITAATWAWNAALWANPITWIVVAIGALVAAVIYAWNNFETFRNVVTAVWNAIKTAVSAVVDWFVNTAWPFLQRVWTGISTGVSIMWNVISFVFNTIKAIATTLFNWFWDVFGPGIQRTWDAVSAGITWLKDRVIQPVMDGIRGIFDTAISAIGTIWNKLIDLAKAPVRFIINTVINDGFIGAYNRFNDWFSGDDIPRMPLPPGFRTGSWIPGSGQGDKIPIMAEPGEFMVRRRSAQSIEAGIPGLLGAMNRDGLAALRRLGVFGYRAGGMIAPVPGGHSGWGSYAGHTGIDYPVPLGTRVVAALDGVVNAVRHLATSYGNHVRISHAGGLESIYAHLSETIVQAGQQVSAGTAIGASGSSGNSTGPHLHFELRQGGQPFDPTGMLAGAEAPGNGSLLSNVLQPVINWAHDLINGLISNIPGQETIIGKMVTGGARKLSDMLFAWVDSKLNDITDSGYTGAGAGAVGAARWSGVASQALAMAGESQSLLSLLLHRIEVESGGDPNAVNNWDSNARAGHPSRGLMQTIPSTFAAYAGPLAGRGITDPLANIYAAIRYTRDRYGGNFGRAWGGVAGYEEGGIIEPPVFDSGGILAPGLNLVNNKTGAPEPLVPAASGAQRLYLILEDGTELRAYVDSRVSRPARMASAGRRTV